MPANLNALIRYKTIDRCLRNRYIRCDIKRLREECSEALGEARGRKQKVSERTIRDDLRVMRSDILGFNAPVVCNNGLYTYSDPGYSIFNMSVNSREVLLQVIELLWKNRAAIHSPHIEELLLALCRIAGTTLPDEDATAMHQAMLEDLPGEMMTGEKPADVAGSSEESVEYLRFRWTDKAGRPAARKAHPTKKAMKISEDREKALLQIRETGDALWLGTTTDISWGVILELV